MSDVIIGNGNLDGKGVFANRDFKKGEVVIQYQLKPLTVEEFNNLPEAEKRYTHTHNGQIYLYSEPERYVNHSANGNVVQDLEKQCDIALRDIRKGEEITASATKDDTGLLKKVDCVLVRVPNLEKGLDFYCNKLRLPLRWKKKDSAGLALGQSELVISTQNDQETDILVDSVEEVVDVFVKEGGEVIMKPEDIPIGKAAVVKDPFGNVLTLLDWSKGLYQTDREGNVTGVK